MTDSHELLGYFDFAALLLVSCILRRSNSTADLQRHHSKLSLLVELLLRLLRRACGLDCLHHWVQRSHADNASNQWAWVHAIYKLLVYIVSCSCMLTHLYTMITRQCHFRQFCSDVIIWIYVCGILRYLSLVVDIPLLNFLFEVSYIELLFTPCFDIL